MQSADLFCCSCNALLITRGEGCLIIAGGGLRTVNQRRDRYTNYSEEDVNKPQKRVSCCFLVACWMTFSPFFYHSKRKFPTTLKENSYILPFNPREEVKMSDCSKVSCFPPRLHVTILRSPKLTTNLNVCSVNSWSSVFQTPLTNILDRQL